MIPSEPSRLDMPFAYEGARNEIPTTGGEDTGNASLSLGFPPITQEPISQGGIPPQRRDFNGILYILSAYAYYAQSGALFSYDAVVDYGLNCIIVHNNEIYISVANNGPSTSAGAVEPGTNTDYWQTLYSYLSKGSDSTAGSATNPIYVKDGEFIASDATVGSGTKPVYLNNGVITASGSTVGSGTKPVYLNSGTITAISSTVGSGTKPVYLSSGTVTASSSTVGSGTTPVYLSGGTVTASSSTVGSGTKPVYLSSGTVTASTSTVGGTAQPVYLNSGTVTALSGSTGSGTRPVYLNGGTITQSSSTVGSGTNPVYMSSGTVTASSSTVGGTARGVYLNSGTITALSDSVGSGTQPVYMNSGTVTASTSTAGDNDTPVYLKAGILTACTGALGTSDYLLDNPGYVKFSCGLIVQWGNTTYETSTGHIDLPISFSNTKYTVVLGNTRDQNDGYINYKYRAYFTFTWRSGEVGTERAPSTAWLAIGY